MLVSAFIIFFIALPTASGFESFVYKNVPPEMAKAAKEIGDNGTVFHKKFKFIGLNSKHFKFN